MTIDELLRCIQKLEARQPLTDAFECLPDTSDRRYDSQKDHLIGWLGGYHTPGPYNRKHPTNDARHFYNHFRCAPGLLWLAEALGEDKENLERAISSVRSAPANPSSQCAAFRREIPWTRINELVAGQRASSRWPHSRSLLRGLLKRA